MSFSGDWNGTAVQGTLRPAHKPVRTSGHLMAAHKDAP
jgi:hypothetical protein